MSQKRSEGPTEAPKDKRVVLHRGILPPGSGVRVQTLLFIDKDGLIQAISPMIVQRRAALAEDIVNILRDQLGMKKGEAAPVAEKILKLFEWYGYRMHDK